MIRKNKLFTRKGRSNVLLLQGEISHRGEKVGYKAARLGQISAEGFPVPEGFVVTADAFRKFCEFNKISLSNTVVAVKRQIQEGDFPLILRENIERTLQKFPFDLYAVRSSAMAEDGCYFSMAGQFATILNTQQEKVLDAIKKCWASLFNSSVQAYLKRRGPYNNTGMGVIIQQQIKSRYSGVLFTLDPIHHSADFMVIEWVNGLGDKLVSGHVIPNTIYLRRKNFTPPDYLPGQLVSIFRQLRGYALRAESLFHQPVDMEWCFSGGKLYILQVRPITTLSKKDTTIWTNVNMTENFPHPLTPFAGSVVDIFYTAYIKNLLRLFGWTPSRLQEQELITNNLTGIQGGRIYYNLTNWYKILDSFPFSRWFIQFLDNYIGQNIPLAPSEPGRPFQKKIKKFLATITFIPRLGYISKTSGRRLNRFESTFYRNRKSWRRISYPNLNLLQLFEKITEVLSYVQNHWVAPGIADLRVMIFSGILDALTKRWIDRQSHTITSELLQGLKLKSTEPAAIILSMSRMIKKIDSLQNYLGQNQYEDLEKSLPVDLRLWFDSFMEQYGCRCYHDCMIINPTFEERHDLFWDLVKSYQNAPDLTLFINVRAGTDAWEIAVKKYTKNLNLIKRFIYRRILIQARKSLAMRESGRLFQSILFGELRFISLEIGRLLKKRECLKEREDIFFLHLEEIDKLIHGKYHFPEEIQSVIDKRKELYQEKMNTDSPELLVLENAEYFSSGYSVDQTPAATTEMRGTGVSKGSYTGKSRVIIDPTTDSQLQPGEILVTRTTDPGWTPLFLIAGGLVLEKGSLLSHGAIVAREFGIPAVVGIDNATKILRSGKNITIDGEMGTVKIMEEEN